MGAELALAVIIGFLQGVFEWLPVSSKTVVMLFSIYIFGESPELAYVLGLYLQSGAVLVAIAYFWRDVVDIALLRNRKFFEFLVISTLSTCITAVPIYIAISRALVLSSQALGWLTIAIGLALILQALLIERLRPGVKRAGDVSRRDSAILGLMQGLAAIPGVSRSGVTIATLLYLGYTSDDALKLSFLASITANLGATALTALTSSTAGALGISESITALAVSAAVGFVSIDLLIRIARIYGHKLTLALGVLAIAIGLATIAVHRT